MATNRNELIIKANVRGVLTNAQEMQQQVKAMNDAGEIGQRQGSRQAAQEMQQLQRLIKQSRENEKPGQFKKLDQKGQDALTQLENKLSDIDNMSAEQIRAVAREAEAQSKLLGKNASKAISSELSKIARSRVFLDNFTASPAAVEKVKRQVEAQLSGASINVGINFDRSGLAEAKAEVAELERQSDQAIRKARADSKKAKADQESARRESKRASKRQTKIVEEVVEEVVKKGPTQREMNQERRALSRKGLTEAREGGIFGAARGSTGKLPGYGILSERERTSLGEKDRLDFARMTTLTQGAGLLHGKRLNQAELRSETLANLASERRSGGPLFTGAQKNLLLSAYDSGMPTIPMDVDRKVAAFRDAGRRETEFQWPDHLMPSRALADRMASEEAARKAAIARNAKARSIADNSEAIHRHRVLSSENVKSSGLVKRGHAASDAFLGKWFSQDQLAPADFPVGTTLNSGLIDYEGYTRSSDGNLYATGGKLNERGIEHYQRLAGRTAGYSDKAGSLSVGGANSAPTLYHYRPERSKKFMDAIRNPKNLLLEAAGVPTAGKETPAWIFERILKKELGMPLQYGKDGDARYTVRPGTDLDDFIRNSLPKGVLENHAERIKQGEISLGVTRNKQGMITGHDLTNVLGTHARMNGRDIGGSMRLLMDHVDTAGKLRPGGLQPRDFFPVHTGQAVKRYETDLSTMGLSQEVDAVHKFKNVQWAEREGTTDISASDEAELRLMAAQQAVVRAQQSYHADLAKGKPMARSDKAIKKTLGDIPNQFLDEMIKHTIPVGQSTAVKGLKDYASGGQIDDKARKAFREALHQNILGSTDHGNYIPADPEIPRALNSAPPVLREPVNQLASLISRAQQEGEAIRKKVMADKKIPDVEKASTIKERVGTMVGKLEAEHQRFLDSHVAAIKLGDKDMASASGHGHDSDEAERGYSSETVKDSDIAQTLQNNVAHVRYSDYEQGVQGLNQAVGRVAEKAGLSDSKVRENWENKFVGAELKKHSTGWIKEARTELGGRKALPSDAKTYRSMLGKIDRDFKVDAIEEAAKDNTPESAHRTDFDHSLEGRLQSISDKYGQDAFKAASYHADRDTSPAELSRILGKIGSRNRAREKGGLSPLQVRDEVRSGRRDDRVDSIREGIASLLRFHGAEQARGEEQERLWSQLGDDKDAYAINDEVRARTQPVRKTDKTGPNTTPPLRRGQKKAAKIPDIQVDELSGSWDDFKKIPILKAHVDRVNPEKFDQTLAEVIKTFKPSPDLRTLDQSPIEEQIVAASKAVAQMQEAAIPKDRRISITPDQRSPSRQAPRPQPRRPVPTPAPEPAPEPTQTKRPTPPAPPAPPAPPSKPPKKPPTKDGDNKERDSVAPLYTHEQPWAGGSPWVNENVWSQANPADRSQWVEGHYKKATQDHLKQFARRVATGGEAAAEVLTINDFNAAKAGGFVTSARQAKNVNAIFQQRSIDASEEYLRGLLGNKSVTDAKASNARGMSQEGAFKAIVGTGDLRSAFAQLDEALHQRVADFAKAAVKDPAQARDIIRNAKEEIEVGKIYGDSTRPDRIGMAKDFTRTNREYLGLNQSTNDMRAYAGQQTTLNNRGLSEMLASRMGAQYGLSYAQYTDASAGMSREKLAGQITRLSPTQLANLDDSVLKRIGTEVENVYDAMKGAGVGSHRFKEAMDEAANNARHFVGESNDLQGTTTEQQDSRRRYQDRLSRSIYARDYKVGDDYRGQAITQMDINSSNKFWDEHAGLVDKGYTHEAAFSQARRNRADKFHAQDEAVGMLKAGVVNMGAFLGGSLLEQGITAVTTQITDTSQAQRALQRVFEVQGSRPNAPFSVEALREKSDQRAQTAAAWGIVKNSSNNLGATQAETAQLVSLLSDGGSHSLSEVEQSVHSLERAAQNTGSTLKDLQTSLDAMAAINLDPNEAAQFLGKFAGLKNMAPQDIALAAQKVGGYQNALLYTNQEREQMLHGAAIEKDRFKGFSSNAYVAAQQAKELIGKGQQAEKFEAPNMNAGNNALDWAKNLVTVKGLMGQITALTTNLFEAVKPVVGAWMAIINVMLSVVNATLSVVNAFGPFKDIIGVILGIVTAVIALQKAYAYLAVVSGKAAAAMLTNNTVASVATWLTNLRGVQDAVIGITTAASRMGATFAFVSASSGTIAGTMAAIRVGAAALLPALVPLLPILAGLAAIGGTVAWAGKVKSDLGKEVERNEKDGQAASDMLDVVKLGRKLPNYRAPGTAGDRLKDMANGGSIFSGTIEQQDYQLGRALSGDYDNYLSALGTDKEGLRQKLENVQKDSSVSQFKDRVGKIKDQAALIQGRRDALSAADLAGQEAASAYTANEQRRRAGSTGIYADILSGNMSAKLDEDIKLGAARAQRDEYERQLPALLADKGVKGGVDGLAAVDRKAYNDMMAKRKELADAVVTAEMNSVKAHAGLLQQAAALRDDKVQQLAGQRSANEYSQKELQIAIEKEKLAARTAGTDGNLRELQKELNNLMLERKQIEQDILSARLSQIDATQKWLELEKQLNEKSPTGTQLSVAKQEAGQQAQYSENNVTSGLADKLISQLRDPNRKHDNLAVDVKDAGQLARLLPTLKRLDGIKSSQSFDLNNAQIDLDNGRVSQATYQKTVHDINSKYKPLISAAQIQVAKDTAYLDLKGKDGQAAMRALMTQTLDPRLQTSTGAKASLAAQKGAYQEGSQRLTDQQNTNNAARGLTIAQNRAVRGLDAQTPEAFKAINLSAGLKGQLKAIETKTNQELARLQNEFNRPGINSQDRLHIATQADTLRRNAEAEAINAKTDARADIFGNRSAGWIKGIDRGVKLTDSKETPDTLRRKLGWLAGYIKQGQTKIDPQLGLTMEQGDKDAYSALTDQRQKWEEELQRKLKERKRSVPDFARSLKSLYGSVTGTVVGGENQAEKFRDQIFDNDVLTTADKIKLGVNSKGKIIKGSQLDMIRKVSGAQNEIKTRAQQYDEDRKAAQVMAGDKEYSFDREGFAQRARNELKQAGLDFDKQRGNFPDLASFEAAKSRAMSGMLQNVQDAERAVRDWKGKLRDSRMAIENFGASMGYGSAKSGKVNEAIKVRDEAAELYTPDSYEFRQASQNVEFAKTFAGLDDQVSELKNAFDTDAAGKVDQKYNINYQGNAAAARALYEQQVKLYTDRFKGKLPEDQFQSGLAANTKGSRDLMENTKNAAEARDKTVRDLEQSTRDMVDSFSGFSVDSMTNKVKDLMDTLARELGKDSAAYKQIASLQEMAANIDFNKRMSAELKAGWNADDVSNRDTQYNIDWSKRFDEADIKLNTAVSNFDSDPNNISTKIVNPNLWATQRAVAIAPQVADYEQARQNKLAQEVRNRDLDKMIDSMREQVGLDSAPSGSRQKALEDAIFQLENDPREDKNGPRLATLRGFMDSAKLMDSTDKALGVAQSESALKSAALPGVSLNDSAAMLEFYAAEVKKSGNVSVEAKVRLQEMTAGLINAAQAAKILGMAINNEFISQGRTNAITQQRQAFGVGKLDPAGVFLSDQTQKLATARADVRSFEEGTDLRREEFMRQSIDVNEIVKLLSTDNNYAGLVEELKNPAKIKSRRNQMTGKVIDTVNDDDLLKRAMNAAFEVKDNQAFQTKNQGFTAALQQSQQEWLDNLSNTAPDKGVSSLWSQLTDTEGKRTAQEIVNSEIKKVSGFRNMAWMADYREAAGTAQGKQSMSDSGKYLDSLSLLTPDSPQMKALQTVIDETRNQKGLNRDLRTITGKGPASETKRGELEAEVNSSNARIQDAAKILKNVFSPSVIDDLLSGSTNISAGAVALKEQELARQTMLREANTASAKLSYQRTSRYTADAAGAAQYYSGLQTSNRVEQMRVFDDQRAIWETDLLKGTNSKTMAEVRTKDLNVGQKAILASYDATPSGSSALSMSLEELSKVVPPETLNKIIGLRQELQQLGMESEDAAVSIAKYLGDTGRAIRDAVQGSSQERLNDSLARRDWAGAGRNAALIVGDKTASLREQWNATPGFQQFSAGQDQALLNAALNNKQFSAQAIEVLQTSRQLAQQIKTASWSASYDDSMSKFDRDVARARPTISESGGNEYDLRMLQQRLSFQKSQDLSGLDSSAIEKVNSDIRNTVIQIETVTQRMQDRWKNFWTGLAGDMMGALKEGLAAQITKTLDAIFQIEDERTRQYKADMSASKTKQGGFEQEARIEQGNADYYQKMADDAKSPEDRKHWLDLRDRAFDRRDAAQSSARSETTNQKIITDNKAIADEGDGTGIWSRAVETMKNSFVSRITGDMLDQSLGKLFDSVIGKISGVQDPQVQATQQLTQANTDLAAGVKTAQDAIATGIGAAGQTYIQAANTMLSAAQMIATSGAGSTGYSPTQPQAVQSGSKTFGSTSGYYDGSYGSPENVPFGVTYGGSGNNTPTAPTSPNFGVSGKYGKGTSNSPYVTAPNLPANKTATKKGLSNKPLISSGIGQQLGVAGVGMIGNAIKIDTGNELVDYGLGFVKSGVMAGAAGLITGGTAGMATALSSAFGPVGIAIAAVGAGIMLLNKSIDARKYAQAWEAENRYGASATGVYNYGVPKSKWLQTEGSTKQVNVTPNVTINTLDPLSSPRNQMEIGSKITRAASVEMLRRGVTG